MGTIRLGKRTDNRVPLIKEFVSLTDLDDLVFGGWDIFEDDMYAAIDGLVDKLDRQVKKHKEKIKNHLHNKHKNDIVFEEQEAE